jgi:hypothetical protein
MSLQRGHPKQEMAQQISAMVDPGTRQRKVAHLPSKKKIPRDQGRCNEGTRETAVSGHPIEVQECNNEREDSEMARICY